MTLRVVRLDPRATLPGRAHPGDAGVDLHALRAATLAPGERAAIPTGIAVEIEPGYAGLILPRSGLAARYGISVVNGPGLIDSGYRGELHVLLLNTDRSETFELRAGDRIAQLVVIAVAIAEPVEVEVEELSETPRGAGGFGSSGR